MQCNASGRSRKQSNDSTPPAEPAATLFGVVGPDGSAPTNGETPQPNGAGAIPPDDPFVVTASGAEPEPGPEPDWMPKPRPEPEPDEFDLRRLRIRREPGSALGIHKRLTTVPVRKPSKEWFVRTHPDREAFWLDTYLIELKEDREVYLVSPELWPALAGESTFSPRQLVLAVSRDGIPFVWPIRLPGPDGKLDSWSQSATDAAMLGQSAWVRVAANMGLGAYEIFEATGIDAEPKWPAESMSEILKAAFRGKFITEFDHPVLKRLRGEV